MDIYCRKCREPWDADEARHGMRFHEYERFRRGEGCPSCRFGTICVDCRGTGLRKGDVHSCPSCYGETYIVVWACANYGNGAYFTGWRPKIREIDENWVEEHTCYDLGSTDSRDGRVYTWLVRCPVCADTREICPHCEGSGAFQAHDKADHTDAFLVSVMEATDGDEIWDAIEALEH